MSRTSTWTWKQIRTQAITEATQNGQKTCLVCGTWLDYNTHRAPNSPEVDHIIPHSQGGKDALENVRVICRTCNRRLGGKNGNARKRKNEATRNFTPREPHTSFNW